MGQWLVGGNSGRKMTRVVHTNTNQKGIGEQNKRNVYVIRNTAHPSADACGNCVPSRLRGDGNWKQATTDSQEWQ